MQTNKKKRNIIIVLMTITLGFIWGNSLLPAAESGAVSQWVHAIINVILGDTGNTGLSGEGVLRKLAHAAEFALLGIELTLLMAADLKRKLPLVALFGLFAALIDETIQLFVVGRSGQIKDVWIDLAGFVVGVAFAGLILNFIYSRKKRRLRRISRSNAQ